MIKKIITTKPHWIILFLGIPNLISILFSIFYPQWNLNSTIGWGWQPTYTYLLEGFWAIVMPVGYWMLLRFKFSINTFFITVQTCLLPLFILTQFSVYGHLTNWLLFLYILATSIIGGRKKGSSNSIDIIDQEF